MESNDLNFLQAFRQSMTECSPDEFVSQFGMYEIAIGPDIYAMSSGIKRLFPKSSVCS